MSKTQPKQNFQIRRIFGLAKPLGCGEDDLRDLAADVSGGRVERLSLVNFDEANAIIVRLGGEAFPPFGRTPRRTVNYHRQQAGVQQIAQKEHLDLMYKLADGRNMTIAGLRSMSERMIKHFPPRTTLETNKIVEALKAMNARDRQRSRRAA